MAARRATKPKTPAPAAPTAPAQSLAREEPDDDEEDEPDGDEDEDDDEDEERAEKLAASAERKRRALAGVPADASLDDEEEDDEEGAEPELESHRELKAALVLQRAENKAALNAHDHAVAKAARRGGRPTTKDIRQAVEQARKRVRERALVHRVPGIYTAEPFTTTDEKGNRMSCPPGMRLPDSLVAGLKARRDLKRLIRDGVLADLR